MSSLSRAAVVIGTLLASISAAEAGGRAATEIYPGLATLPPKAAADPAASGAAATTLVQADPKPQSGTKASRRARRTRFARQMDTSPAAAPSRAASLAAVANLPAGAVASLAQPAPQLGIEQPARTPADLRPGLDRPQEQAAPTIASLIAKHAEANGVPVDLAEAVVRIESRGNAHASNAGAMGLMQIKTQTARAAGFMGGALGLLDAETNLRYGMKVLAAAYRDSGGDVCRALMKYQSGHLATRMTHANRVYCSKARAVMAGA